MPFFRLPFGKIFFLLCFLILWGSRESFAQKITLNGTVSDSKTGAPVSGVGTILSKSGKAAATDKQGSFLVPTDTIFPGETLIFSHVSYETLTVPVTPGQTRFMVTLTPKVNPLGEVSITAFRKLKPQKIRPETTLDYAITNNRLYLLGWEAKRKNLVLQVLHLETGEVLMQNRLPFLAENLFVDCLQNLHLLTEDKVYQVFTRSDSLALYPPNLRTEFDQHLKPCLAANGSFLYFSRDLKRGVIRSFYAVDQETKETKMLRTIQDEIVLSMQRGEQRFQFFKALQDDSRPDNTVEGPGPSTNALMKAGKQARVARRTATSKAFAQKIMFEAPYLPLIQTGNQLALFDHVNGKIEFYKYDSLSRVLLINYQHQKDWAKQIVVDAAAEKTYALFQKNGLYELKHLNLETGELGRTYQISNPFASKISVHNCQVYFLYKDPGKNNRQFLYQAQLASGQN